MGEMTAPRPHRSTLYAFDSEFWRPAGFYMGVLTHPQTEDREGRPVFTVFNTPQAARAYFADCPITDLALASPRADFEAWSDVETAEGWFYPPGIRIWNTTALHWLYDENQRHGLADTCKEFLGYEMRKPIHMRDGRPFFRTADGSDVPLEDAPYDEVLEYCKIDSSKTRDVVPEIWGRLDLVHRRWYWECEAEIDRIVFQMRARGVEMDIDRLAAAKAVGSAEREAAKQAVFDAVGYEFLLNSGDQVAKLLFSSQWTRQERQPVGQYKTGRVRYGKVDIKLPGLGLTPPGGRTTLTGKRYASDTTALRMLAAGSLTPKAATVVNTLLTYREIDKIVSTYLSRYEQYMTGTRLRGRFNPIGPVTGRYSSSEPNLQNQPKRGRWGKILRDLFVAAPGNVLVVADQAQVEMRITAALSRCESLIAGFENGEDIHMINARLAGSNDRHVGKTLGYATIYGVGPTKLAEQVGISVKAAEALLARYFDGAPEIAKWMQDIVAQAREDGYVTMVSGRRRRLPDIKSHDNSVRWRAERQAVNSLVQGTAADIVKMWQIECRHLPQILVVHDELVVEVPEAQGQQAADALVAGLQAAVERLAPGGLGVDIITEPVICKRWGEKDA